jgi:O-antigen ligase
MSSTGDTRHAGAVGVAAAALVLSPLLTTTLPFQRALIVQAALVLAITLSLGVFSLARKGWRKVLAAPRMTVVGVALYAAAALQGTVVALVRGNDLKLAAGQLLAMGLLPLAAVAALGVSTALSWRAFATGLVGAVAAGTLVQAVVAGPAMVAHFPGTRLMLPNAVSVAGAAAMALLFALALTRSGLTSARALAWAAAALTVALIFVSGIRSQWLVMPLGLAVFLALGLGRTRLLSRRALLAWGTALLFLTASLAATARWWTRPRPNLTSGHLESAATGDAGTAVVVLPGSFRGAIRVRGTLTCRGSGIVYMRLRGTGEAPTNAPDRVVPLVVAGAAPSEFWIVHRPLPAETALAVRLEDPSNLGCRTTAFAVEGIAPAPLAELVRGLAGMLHRPPDPGSGATPGVAAGDASIAFRLRETRAVLTAIREASWPWRLVGQGLGATFAFDTVGYDNRGNVVRYERPNYLHNFYLFLLFKLGVLGALAVLTALAIWVLTAVRGARAKPNGTADRWFLAAAAAAWVTYIVWSVAAPEILDFRLAPVWGLLVATTARTVGRPEASGETRAPFHIAEPRPDALTWHDCSTRHDVPAGTRCARRIGVGATSGGEPLRAGPAHRRARAWNQPPA